MVFFPLFSMLPLAARKEENTRSLLNDKREVAAQRQRYEQYSVVVEEVGVPRPLGQYWAGDTASPWAPPTHACAVQVLLQPGESLSSLGGDYEDEYDDTYDGNQVGANDADSDDELISRR